MDSICFEGKCINLQLRELIPQKLILLQQVTVHWKWFCWLFNLDIWPNVYISAQRQYRTGCIQHASPPRPPPILSEEISLKNNLTHKQRQSNAFEIPLPKRNCNACKKIFFCLQGKFNNIEFLNFLSMQWLPWFTCCRTSRLQLVIYIRIVLANWVVTDY